MPQKPYLLASGLTYQLPPARTLFKDVQVSVMSGDRIALVGENGIGKSTLLKILAGQIAASAGSISRYGSVYYLPQISTLPPQFQMRTGLDVLSSISEDWWAIAAFLETQFNTSLDLSLSIAQLSGGELTKLFLAIGLYQQPNILLLDEPTNHIDYRALAELHHCVRQFEGAVVAVSHKPFFLNQVTDTTWELTPDGLTVYGGNFSFYREQKQTELAAKLRSHEAARQEVKRRQETAMQEQKRSAQSQRKGRLQAESMPKVLAGTLQRQAEVTAGKQKVKHEIAIAEARQKVADTKVRTNRVTRIQLPERDCQPRHAIDLHGVNLWLSLPNYPLERRLLIQNIQFHLAVGDRVAIAGANGCGKSSLVKALLNNSNCSAFLESGEVFISPGLKAVYLDRTYDWVNRDLTVLENMQAANPDLCYQQMRQQLGHFLFFDRTVECPASVLSGGELARLALATISISEIDLLVLDEPTNNLDIPTVDCMVDALNYYKGGLLVISHDLDFLSRLQLSDSYWVSNLKLRRTVYLPNEPEKYYSELNEKSIT